MLNTNTSEQLSAHLDSINAHISASELHGHLIGRHVGGHEIVSISGNIMLADLLSIQRANLDQDGFDWSGFLNRVQQEFGADHYAFQLLLPADERELADRLVALSDWCLGFLNGIGCALNAGDYESMLEGDATLEDIVEISNIDSEAEDSDENEALYVELVEYVRLGVLNVHENISEKLKKQADEADQIH